MSKKNKPPKEVKVKDAFQNIGARLGYGTQNLMEGTEYPLTRLTKNYLLMNSLYRSHWIVRRVIDIIPEDMCKNWYKITSQMTPEQIEKFTKLDRLTNVKSQVLKGLKWGRLYGGAVGVILLEGHEDVLDQPLEIEDIYPGQFKGILILDRWSGVFPELDLVTDIGSREFGMPKYYKVTSDLIPAGVRVHHSRVLRFIGRDLPYWEEIAEQRWGASEVEHIFDDLKKRDNVSWNIAQLVFLANLKVLKMNDLGQSLSIANDAVQEQLYNTISAQNALMNNMGMYVMDKEDDFSTHQYTFSGLSEVYENFMMDVAGAAEIPITKLFGRSPGGLNSTGDGDLQNYYDTIEVKQEAYLRPVIDKLLPVMCMSEFGAIPDDLDYEFNPISKIKDSDKIDIGQKNTAAIVDTFNSGLISQKIALKELRQMKETTGLWSNITDEDIEKADDETNNPGEYSPDLGPEDVGQEVQEATGKTLNGAQTSSLLSVMEQYSAGALSEGQAINVISVSIGVSKEEAKNIINGMEDKTSNFNSPSADSLTVDGGEGSGNFNHKGRAGEIGGSGEGGGGNKNLQKPLKLKTENGTINVTGNIKVEVMDEGEYNLVKGSKITKIVPFAGKNTDKTVKVAKHLTKEYGGKEADWQHTRGEAVVDYKDQHKQAEIHWFENEDVGVIKMKVKRWRK